MIYSFSDETNRTFFEPLATHYNLKFLSDFQEVVDQVDPNFIGMIDQVVCSRGRVFVGTYFSSFSAYIGKSCTFLLEPSINVNVLSVIASHHQCI